MKMMKLSSLGTLRNGMNYDKSSAVRGCKIIGVADFGTRVFPDYDALSEIDSSIVTEDDILQNGDILFVRSNGNKNLVGRTMFIRDIKESVCYSGFCIAFRPNADVVYPEYLFYVLRAPFCKKQYSYSQQTNITNLSQGVLGDVDVPVPAFDTQQKLAKILSDLDLKITSNTRICAELESMAKTLYDYWFTQFDFPNAEGKPYRNSGGEMVWNAQLKREIPKGWSNCKLKDYANSVTRSTSPGEHLRDLFYTPIDEIPKRQMSFWGGLSYTEAKSSLQLYQENDILIGAMRVYFHRVCIAAQRGITRSTTMVLQARNTEDLAFIYELFNHDQTIQYANKISVGTQQPYVNWDDALDSMDVIAPEHSVIAAFCKHMDPIIEKVKCLVQENYELIKLRDWLLPMLMNGQATVE